MKQYELTLPIIDLNYLDSLIVALVRQGYNVYYNDELKILCCTITEEDIQELKY